MSSASSSYAERACALLLHTHCALLPEHTWEIRELLEADVPSRRIVALYPLNMEEVLANWFDALLERQPRAEAWVGLRTLVETFPDKVTQIDYYPDDENYDVASNFVSSSRGQEIRDLMQLLASKPTFQARQHLETGLVYMASLLQMAAKWNASGELLYEDGEDDAFGMLKSVVCELLRLNAANVPSRA